MDKTQKKLSKTAADLAAEHEPIVLASALMLRLMNDGRGPLAGQVLSALAGELGIDVSELNPNPPSPG
jgi:hypothetical protein